MASILRGFKYLFTNRMQFCDSMVKNFLSFLPDKLYLSLRYRCIMGHSIDWEHPQTFSEKIQWLKVNHRHPKYTTIVDKYAVNKRPAKIITQSTLAVICDIDSGNKFVSLKYVIIHPITPCSAHK